MTEPVSSRELVRVIAAEFDRRGWRDEDGLALAVASQVEHEGQLDADAGAARASESFLSANAIDASGLAEVLGNLFSGRSFGAEEPPGPTFVDQSVTIGDNNTISGDINAGGNQLHLTNNTPAAELLSGFTDFVATAAVGGFSPREVELLDRLLEDRGIGAEQAEAAALTGIEQSGAEPGRLARFRDSVMSGTASGLAVKGILAALGTLL